VACRNHGGRKVILGHGAGANLPALGLSFVKKSCILAYDPCCHMTQVVLGVGAWRSFEMGGSEMNTRKLTFEHLESRDLLSADVGYFAVGDDRGEPPAATVQWQTQAGGPSYEEARSMVAAPDGGYVAAGWTNSAGAGDEDAFVVKVDEQGDVVWTRTFGGAELDRAYSIHTVSTGGYIVAGRTRSDEFTHRYEAAYMVRISAEGDLLWEKAFGLRRANGARHVEHTQDGGFIISGWTSNQRHSNQARVYLVKTDADGEIEWQKQFQKKSRRQAQEIQQTSDGGYVLAGLSRPRRDLPLSGYMMKLDASGNTQWQRVIGTRWGWDELYTVEETPAGDFLFGGGTKRWMYGQARMRTWLIKTDADGKILWNRWYGGGFGYSWGSTLTADGNIALAGRTSNSQNVALLVADADDGDMQWGMKFGSLDDGQQYSDGGRPVVATSDGGLVLNGYIGKAPGPRPHSGSQADYDRDFWFVKLAVDDVEADQSSPAPTVWLPLESAAKSLRLDTPATPTTTNDPTPLTQRQVAAVFDAAVAGSVRTAPWLNEIEVRIVDLAGRQLGRAVGTSRIELDVDAAGAGWFVDPTPEDDREFRWARLGGDLRARPGSDAEGRVDLLTVLAHELHHLQGKLHAQHGVMQDLLPVGTRRAG